MHRSRRGIALVVTVALLVAAAAPALGGLVAPDGPDPDPLQPDRTSAVPERLLQTDGTEAAVAAGQVANTSPRRLQLGGGERVGESGSPTATLGTAVSVGDTDLRARFDRYRARQSLAAADNETDRRVAVRRVLEATAGVTDRLREQETAAVRAYHAGAIDRAELLRRLARIQVVADEYRRTLEEVRTRADGGGVLTTELRNEIISTRAHLSGFQSPVRERIAVGVTGEDVGRVRVTATENGLTLETVLLGLYVRDAVRVDRYEATGGEPLDGEIANRLRAVYPYAFEAPPRSERFRSAGDRLIRVQFLHPQGQVKAFLNRETGAVYRETQWLHLDQVYTETVVNRTTEGVRVTVDRVGGQDPTRVRLVDENTEIPVGATVVLGNRTLGPTEDGQLWLLLGPTPANLTLRTDRGVINVTVGTPAGNASVAPASGTDDRDGKTTGDRALAARDRPA